MADVGTIERTLGFTEAAKPSLLSLSRRIEHGFLLESLTRISRLIAPNDKSFENRIVPASTLKHRRQQNKPLSPEESARVQRVARAWTAAMDVYQREDMAGEFLTRPHPMLDRQKPLDVALCNTPGLEATETLLSPRKIRLAGMKPQRLFQ